VPHSTSATVSGSALPVFRACAPSSFAACRAPSLHGEGAGHAERIEAVQVAARGSTSGCAAGRRPGPGDEAAVERACTSASSSRFLASSSWRSPGGRSAHRLRSRASPVPAACQGLLGRRRRRRARRPSWRLRIRDSPRAIGDSMSDVRRRSSRPRRRAGRGDQRLFEFQIGAVSRFATIGIVVQRRVIPARSSWSACTWIRSRASVRVVSAVSAIFEPAQRSIEALSSLQALVEVRHG
jgi:hypothetical protein